MSSVSGGGEGEFYRRSRTTRCRLATKGVSSAFHQIETLARATSALVHRCTNAYQVQPMLCARLQRQLEREHVHLPRIYTLIAARRPTLRSLGTVKRGKNNERIRDRGPEACPHVSRNDSFRRGRCVETNSPRKKRRDKRMVGTGNRR